MSSILGNPLFQLAGNALTGILGLVAGENTRKNNPQTRFTGLLGNASDAVANRRTPGVDTVKRQTGFDPAQSFERFASPAGITEQQLGEAGRLFEAQQTKNQETRAEAGRMQGILDPLVAGAQARAADLSKGVATGRASLGAAMAGVEQLKGMIATLPVQQAATMKATVSLMNDFYQKASDENQAVRDESVSTMTAHLEAAHIGMIEQVKQAKDALAREMQMSGAAQTEIDIAMASVDRSLASNIFTTNKELAATEHERHTEVMTRLATNMTSIASSMSDGIRALGSQMMSERGNAAQLMGAATELQANIGRQQAEFEVNTKIAADNLYRYADGLEFQGNWDISQMIRDIQEPVLMTSPIAQSALQLWTTLATADNEVVNSDNAATMANWGILISAIQNGLNTGGQLADSAATRASNERIARSNMWGNIIGGTTAAVGDATGGMASSGLFSKRGSTGGGGFTGSGINIPGLRSSSWAQT